VPCVCCRWWKPPSSVGGAPPFKAARQIPHEHLGFSPRPLSRPRKCRPQSHNFRRPHFANHAKRAVCVRRWVGGLAAMSDTFNIGVMCFAFIARSITSLSRRSILSPLCHGPQSVIPKAVFAEESTFVPLSKRQGTVSTVPHATLFSLTSKAVFRSPESY
jgi:hypothetical protein